uniref:Uncharacterized protein n=1 Tax=Physcomitrium patens TaxID=3218 RepID=A0A7I4DMQ7_PHYPA
MCLSMASCCSPVCNGRSLPADCARRPIPGIGGALATQTRRQAVGVSSFSSILSASRVVEGDGKFRRFSCQPSFSSNQGDYCLQRRALRGVWRRDFTRGCDVRGGGIQVVSLERERAIRCCSENKDAMASSRKLPHLQGILFKYGSKSNQVAFKTGNYKQQVVFIGGLTDGFLATDYVEPLAKALEAEKWSLVQPLLTSSYTGFGTSSLKEDAVEIELLLNYLIDQEDSEGFILVGHSTGCQDIVHYLRTGGHCTRAVRGAILQAPVSDREFRATLPETQPMLELAERMIKEGKGEELMPRDASPEAPITANRFRSLCAYMGDDDLFSSDFTDAQLKALLGHMSRVPCQVRSAFSQLWLSVELSD